MKPERYNADFIIVGSGISGLITALKLSETGKTILLTKKKIEDSATNLAQGGIAAALKKGDLPRFHYNDTLKAGHGLCNKKAVKILVEDGVERVKELIKMGVDFDKYNKNELDFTKEGAHSKRRILHSGDSTGEAIEKVLIKKVKANKNIKVLQHTKALDLIVKNKTCYGILAKKNNNDLIAFLSKAVVLATGGVAHVYLQSTHPFVCTGDGIAMAYRSGGSIENMEFIQFHPTTLYARKTWQREPLFLISEAIRGEGAILRNVLGEDFMPKYHPLGSLAPRDIVSRAIVKEMQSTLEDRVFLDFTEVKVNLAKRFPNIYQRCKEEGYEIENGYLPVAPAAHYLMGGIKTDTYGKTNIKNLYAVGENASTGVHGANRLASNSLLEGLVFGSRAAEDIIKKKKIMQQVNLEQDIRKLCKQYKNKVYKAAAIKKKIQKIMWFKVGIIRNGRDLKDAIRELNSIKERELAPEAKNMLLIAKLITKAALKRKVSRGAHYRSDSLQKKSL